ncbi:GNAT family N-acetyltransferase [Nocardioides donggukensis]|uniref:GNAT family N-acetyltransferase n=1 Tax=Nocardioides donggukensis TaxID=2774019 RepID=A0A927Q088_9ACTN|nr:GNAT family protein [Nocardioides donggukensis]MBD8870330.1 GNAT family N-acetyltransferase [Nocardioides donggukensis]
MTGVLLRPLLPGELADARPSDGGFDDFGPRPGYASPPPCSLDEPGAMAVLAGGRLAGSVSWIWQRWGPNHGSRCPMIGIWLAPEHRGHGYGTQAQSQLVDLLFRHTPANRVEAHTDVDNRPERRALEKAGFTAEGVVRGAQWRDGDWRDGVLYSVLRAERGA